jgi:hypothetical protein
MVGNPLNYPLTLYFKMITDVQTVADENIFLEKSVNFSSPNEEPVTSYTPPLTKKGSSSTRSMRLSEVTNKASPHSRHSTGPTSVTSLLRKSNATDYVKSTRGFKMSFNMKIKRIWEFSVAEMKGIRPNMEDTISIAQSSIFQIPVSYRKSPQDKNKKVDDPSTKNISYQSNDTEEDDNAYDDIMFTLFCVFDGHSDSKVAEFCACNFHKILFHKLGLSFNFNQQHPQKQKTRTIDKESSLLQKPKFDPIVVPKVITTTVTTTTITTVTVKTKSGSQQTKYVETVVEKTTATEDGSTSKQSNTSPSLENPRQPYSFPPPPPSVKLTSSLSSSTLQQQQSSTESQSQQQSKQLQGQNSSENVTSSSKKDDTQNDTTKDLHSAGKMLSNEPTEHRQSLVLSCNLSSTSSRRRLNSVDEPTSPKSENKSTDTTAETTTSPKSENKPKSTDSTESKSVQKHEPETTEPNPNTEPEAKTETSSPSVTPHRDTHKRRRKSDTSSASNGPSSRGKHKKTPHEVKIKPEDKYDFHETSVRPLIFEFS